MQTVILADLEKDRFKFTASVVGCDFDDEGNFSRTHIGIFASLEVPTGMALKVAELYRDHKHPHRASLSRQPIIPIIREDTEKTSTILIGEPITAPTMTRTDPNIENQMRIYEEFLRKVETHLVQAEKLTNS